MITNDLSFSLPREHLRGNDQVSPAPLKLFRSQGEKETRAWTIPKGALAPEAAGKIHTDIQKGFIRAEVIFL